MVNLIKPILEQWNHSGINYAVAKGLEAYPHRTGRDIDVVVDPLHLELASKAVCAALQQRGWRVAVQTYPELVQHFGIGPAGTDLFIVDLFPGLRWGPVWLVKQPDASVDANGIRVDPWVSFVKRILLHVLVAPTQRFTNDLGQLQLSEAEAKAALARLPHLIGAASAARLLSEIERQDIDALEALRSQLRRGLILSSVARAPLSALWTAVQCARTRVTFATTRPMMPALTIASSDSIDRASVLHEVTRQAQERLRCPVVTVRSGRPGILPRLPSEGMRAAATSASRAAYLMSAGRALYFALDFVLGRVLLDRRIGVDLGLVLYDGGALEMYVNPGKFGLRSGRWARLLPAVVARSGVSVLLYCEDDERTQRDSTVADSDLIQMAVAINSGPRVAAERIVERLVQEFSDRNGGDDGQHGFRRHNSATEGP